MGIPERKEREKERRRNDIIDAAEKIFFSKGVENSTMDEVAEEAELSKGTLYLYFQSKEDLQFAIFMRGIEIIMDMMNKHLSPGKNGYENLLELAETFISFSKKHKDYFELFMFFLSSNLEKLNIEKAQIEKYLKEQSPLTLVNECVRKGVEDGSLRNDLPLEDFAATLWSQLLGVLIVIENKKDVYEVFGVNVESIVKIHLELVSHGGLKH